MSEPLLAIEGLRIAARGNEPLVDGLTFSVMPGEIVALVGESGCGKSMTALSVMGLLPPGTAVTAGTVRLHGQDLLTRTPRQMDAVRGRNVGMIFQQPQAMLDPTARVGTHIAEALRRHRGLRGRAAAERVVELLREVGIPEPRLRANAFAHELSGGMAQRVMIAAALSGGPDLLIADEPTTALDVTVQVQILRLLAEERRTRGLAILLITHDLSVVSALADRVVVMYAGAVVEQGQASAIFAAPRHPYTRALVRCSLMQPDGSGRLASIRGSASGARTLACGCRFHPRCDHAAALGLASCRDAEPALTVHEPDRLVRCWAADTV